MSVKDVRNYYNQICDQYSEMLENIRDLEAECAKGIVEPERIDRLKEQIEPIKVNFQRWSYMMFLLNQPTRKEKVAKYESMNKKLLQSIDKSNTADAVIEENNEALRNVGK